jgi:hypothetical protein
LLSVSWELTCQANSVPFGAQSAVSVGGTVAEDAAIGVDDGVADGDGLASSAAVADGDGLGFGDDVPADAEHPASRRHATPAQAVTNGVGIPIGVISR